MMFLSFYAMTLEQLIGYLEMEDDVLLPIGFTNPHSYRGHYEDLAFEPIAEITTKEMLTKARGAVGTTYQGYKGGSYEMGSNTRCWISKEGSADGVSIDNLTLGLLIMAGKKWMTLEDFAKDQVEMNRYLEERGLA
jgi:hypothetical protein